MIVRAIAKRDLSTRLPSLSTEGDLLVDRCPAIYIPRLQALNQGDLMSNQPPSPTVNPGQPVAGMNFESLVRIIQEANTRLRVQADRAINISLTLRNWLIGCYVTEYERQGVDRAGYGERLMTVLTERLEAAGLANCGRRQLYT